MLAPGIATLEAERLPVHLVDTLLDPAREAFTGALNVVAVIGAVAVVVFAFLAILLLRHVSPGGETSNKGI
jgi:MFS transporter, DHA2 family, multidrug resistance protein